jgi:hypothetical protein
MVEAPTAMNSILSECRTYFGDPPRSLSLGQKLRFRIYPSLRERLSYDPLLRICDDQKKLRDRGRVVWGHLVQANALLFGPGPTNCPANVIYEPSPPNESSYAFLAPIAHSIFALKGKRHVDEDLDECARWVTSERLRMVNAPIPAQLSRGRAILFSTLLIHRKHLPAGYLSCSFFPLVINPDETPSVMILPSEYWPVGVAEMGT